MNDLISRQAVFDVISELNAISFYEAQEDSKECYYEIRKAIEQIPSVNPQRTGHWISLNTGKPSRIKDGIPTESVRCSECDEWLTASDEYACKGNYCPNCGCRMVEPQESEEV